MAYFKDEIKVPVAVKGKHGMNLNSQHITTGDFFKVKPVFVRECVPGDDLSVNIETFSRMAPLATPTFSRCSINNRGFWVPFRTVWRGFTAFITDSPQPTSSGAVVDTKVPSVKNVNLIRALTGVGDATKEGVWMVQTTSASYDVIIKNDNSAQMNGGTTVIPTGMSYWTFTYEGRQVYSVLRSLGYAVQWHIANDLSEDNEYSMLPLMCYIKVILDWYYPSQYAGQSLSYSAVDYWLKQDRTFAWSAINVMRIFDLCANTNYQADYFVSNWDNPVAPSDSTFSSFQFIDVTNNATNGGNSSAMVVTNDASLAPYPSSSNYKPSNGTPFVGGLQSPSSAGSSYMTGVFTQYVDTALHRLTDYVRRHQMTSVRPLDRYLSRFGIALAPEKLERSVYLGSDVIDFQIGDVMSTADTTTASLGSYKGKGAAYGGKTMDYNTDEYGMFIIMSSIVPHVGYVQGIRRHVMHLSKSDIYQPEFDCLGTQATSAQELYMSNDGSTSYSVNNLFNGQVFGFLPRYAEYAVMHDTLSGEFLFKTKNSGMDSWHTFRMFDDTQYAAASDVVHSQDFVTGNDDLQYSRIFQVQDKPESENDNFYLIYNFNVGLQTYKKPLWDSYEFEEAGSKQVTNEVGGVKMD